MKHGIKPSSTLSVPSKCYFSLYTFSQALQCVPETKKVKASQISASRNTSHPCSASNDRRNPNFNADVVVLIASLPTSTETEIWYLGHHFFLCTDEHWAFCLETVKLICLQNGTREKKKNNWREQSFFLCCRELKSLSFCSNFNFLVVGQ